MKRLVIIIFVIILFSAACKKPVPTYYADGVEPPPEQGEGVK